MTCRANILIVDDEESIRAGCVQILSEEGYRARAVDSGHQALAAVEDESFDVVLLDLKMPGISGMETLRQITVNDPAAIVIVITGYGTIDTAVEAMKAGAFDFVTKPFSPDALLDVVAKAVADRRRELTEAIAEPAAPPAADEDEIIGRSRAIEEVRELIRRVAPTDSTVLIHGETGVGKELVARNIHRLGARRNKPFVVVDCGTLVESLFESELFGHRKGSFTGAIESTSGKFELADGGTIFLDEITNISFAMQSRLLRVIQEKEITRVGSLEKVRVDVRIVSATNRDLAAEIAEGRFREDLFYRLNVVPIHLPPLRERREDIPVLADHFLRKAVPGEGGSRPSISPRAMRFLSALDWPGNVRELKNAVECAVVTSSGPVVGAEDFPIAQPATPAAEPSDDGPGALARSEKREIIRALRQFDGHRAKAAEYLGINRKTLREKIRRYDIED